MSNELVINVQKDLVVFKELAQIAMRSKCNGNLTFEDTLNIMLTARDLGVSPMKALNGGFYVVNNKVIMSTALMADRIRKAGHSVKIPEWTSEKCAIIGVRKDNGDSIRLEYTMDDAQRAGLLKSPTWQKFPKNMLYNRAMSTLARVLFSDVVGNCYSEDEANDIQNIPAEQRPLESDPVEINVKAVRMEVEESAPQVIEAEVSDASFAPEDFSPREKLKELLKEDGFPIDQFDFVIKAMASRKNNPEEKIINSALVPDIFPRFKEVYLESLPRTA